MYAARMTHLHACRFVSALATLAFVCSSAFAGDFTLSVTGSCKQPNMVITISGATPNDRIAVFAAWEQEAYWIPDGFPCAGTQLDLFEPFAYQVFETHGGTRFLDIPNPGPYCGMQIQAVDRATCDVSNSISL